MAKKHCYTILFLLVSLILFTTSACNSDSSNLPSEVTNLSSTECRMMTHAMGETCIPNNPQRIATISDFTLHHVLALGVRPIGNAVDGWRSDVPDYLTNKTEGIERLGISTQPNLEKILELRPDLILSWGYIPDVYPLLAQIAPTVMDTLEGSSGNDVWREHFAFVAEALDRQEIAQQAWNQYYQRIEGLKEALGEQYKNKRISIMTVAPDFENHASSRNSFVGSVLSDAGLTLTDSQNIDSGAGWIQYSSEEFTSFFDGDILFVTITGDADSIRLEELKSNPFWAQLKAVEQGNVYIVDSLTWQGANLLAANAVIDDLLKYLVNAS